MVASLWNFLSGEVPGGFAVPLVLLISFYPVLEFVYRASEFMAKKTYRRWQWLGPAIIIGIYAIFWIQSPPKIEPLRIAVIVEENSLERWRSEAVADLTARRLRSTLNKIIVNPWTGVREEYPEPSIESLQKSKYRVYQIDWLSKSQGVIAEVRVISSDGNEISLPIAKDDLQIISGETVRWILTDLKKRESPENPFKIKVQEPTLNAYYRGIYWLKSQQPDSAEIHFLQALAIDSTFTPAKIGWGLTFEMSGDRENAENVLLDAVQGDTTSNEALLILSEFYLRGLQWDKAEPPLKVLITRDPLEVRAYYGLTKIHPDRLKDLRLTTQEELLKEAVRLDPAFEKARLSLVTPLLQRGASGRARKILQKGLAINPDSEDFLLKSGALELYAGNAEKARSIYLKILENDPISATAAFNLGVVDYRTKQYDSAIENFRKSLAWGGSVDSFYYLGQIHRIKGDNPKAIFYYLKRWENRSSDDDAFAIKAKQNADALEKEKFMKVN